MSNYRHEHYSSFNGRIVDIQFFDFFAASQHNCLGFLATMIRITLTTLLCLQATKHLAAQQSGDTAHQGPAHLLDDPISAETGFASAVQAGSKYFQDLYMAQESPEELEFGHVRETPHDWEQRYEKMNLRNLKRQGKVRWGDKHGGYGEHYWDYNHDGHHDGDGEESQHEPQYAEPEIPLAPITSSSSQNSRYKRGHLVDSDVEFIGGEEGRKKAALSGPHGGNYRRHPRVERIRRQFGDEDY
ncbi:uncharacterized protein [Atheta coriaria]|uniref:uncharacterized protein isoform X1 n=1 Tax=Dalotia coriaria TaxID=877792 RepID=UPI0031F43AEC